MKDGLSDYSVGMKDDGRIFIILPESIDGVPTGESVELIYTKEEFVRDFAARAQLAADLLVPWR